MAVGRAEPRTQSLNASLEQCGVVVVVARTTPFPACVGLLAAGVGPGGTDPRTPPVRYAACAEGSATSVYVVIGKRSAWLPRSAQLGAGPLPLPAAPDWKPDFVLRRGARRRVSTG